MNYGLLHSKGLIQTIPINYIVDDNPSLERRMANSYLPSYDVEEYQGEIRKEFEHSLRYCI